MIEVKVLYDFEAQPGSGELAIKAGEMLKVTRQDVGQGWWEGYNSSGQSGLFPEAYVEVVEAVGPPSVPPPPLPPEYREERKSISSAMIGANQAFALPGLTTGPPANDPWNDPWNETNNQTPQPVVSGWQAQGPGNAQAATPEDEDWDEDWDEESDAASSVQPGPGGAPVERRQGPERRGGPGQRSLRSNRFSVFAKSGIEDYFLGPKKDADLEERIRIIEVGDEFNWEPVTEKNTLTVTHPKKETKLKGLKSFIAYQITPSVTNIPVSRRYKHFDWLWERLQEKTVIVPVPPLPDKCLTGRYEIDFIEHRRSMLEDWVARIARHPVLSRTPVWNHFIRCTDEKGWKAGKRRAEKDEFSGINFFQIIDAPERQLQGDSIELELDAFGGFSAGLLKAVSHLQSAAVDQLGNYQNKYHRDYSTIGTAFLQLGMALDRQSLPHIGRVKDALKNTGETYESIAALFRAQPKEDFEPLSDRLHTYRGLLQSVPDNLNFHRAQQNKRRELERQASEKRIESSTVRQMARRSDVISYAVLSEVAHIRSELSQDFMEMGRQFLENQIKFHREIVSKLEASLQYYK